MTKIIIKKPHEIDNIRIAGKHLTTLLWIIQKECTAGKRLLDLEKIAEDYIGQNWLKGAFKWYHGFPANLCLSNNDCLVHGIPDDTRLVNGDVLKIDCGITYKKWIADSAITVIVWGEHTNAQWAQLLEATKNWLDHCLQFVQPGNTLWQRGQNINNYIEDAGFTIIKHLTGHGVGTKVHEAPHIYNRAHPDTKNIRFEPGMVVALEPITAITSDDFYEGDNKRNLYTNEGDIGAQWEYTVLITEDGHEVLAGIQ